MDDELDDEDDACAEAELSDQAWPEDAAEAGEDRWDHDGYSDA